MVIASSVLVILLPFALALIIHRRWPLSGKVMALGAGMFIVAQVIKALFAVPILSRNILVPGSFSFVLFGALLPGVWEEVTKFVPLKRLRRKTWNIALSFGLGFGGIEAVYIGIQVLALALAIASGKPLPPIPDVVKAQLAPASAGAAAMFLVGGLVERLSAIAVHTGFTFLHVRSLQTRRAVYSILAVILHTGLDITAGMLQALNGDSASLLRMMVPVELLYIMAGIISLSFIRRMVAQPYDEAA